MRCAMLGSHAQHGSKPTCAMLTEDCVVQPKQMLGGGGASAQAKSAKTPLATGRLLTYADVSPSLRGRQAEVRSQHVLAGPCQQDSRI